MESHGIRPECLCPAVDGWERPTADEVRKALELAGFSGSKAAEYLGLGKAGGRTVRRWTGGETHIPYSSWALLCYAAGLGTIWVKHG